MLNQQTKLPHRYAAVRKQFGPSPDNELPILEYQTHQCRLFPHLACGFVYYVLGETLFRVRISCYVPGGKGIKVKKDVFRFRNPVGWVEVS